MNKKKRVGIALASAAVLALVGGGPAQAAITVYGGLGYTGDILYSGSATYADLWDNQASSAKNITSYTYWFYDQQGPWENVIAIYNPNMSSNIPGHNNEADHIRR